MKRKITVLLFLVSVIWGFGFVVVQTAIDTGTGPFGILAFRFIIGSAILAVLFRNEIPSITKNDWKRGGIAGFLLFVSFFLQTAGLKYTTPSNNAFLTATYVVMVPFLSWMVFRKRPAAKIFISALFCFTGICILSVSWEGGLSFSLGDSLTLLCALFFTIHTVILGVYAADMNTKILILTQLSTAAVLSSIGLLLFEPSFPASESWWALLYLGVLSTGVAYSVQTYAQKFAHPAKVSIIMSMESVFGLMFSVLLGFEAFSFRLLLGSVIILVSIMLIELPFPAIVNNLLKLHKKKTWVQ